MRLHPAILADRGGQQFKDRAIQENLLPIWFNYGAVLTHRALTLDAPLPRHSLQAVLQVGVDAAQPFEGLFIGLPEAPFAGFEQPAGHPRRGVGVKPGQPLAHGLVEQVGLGDAWYTQPSTALAVALQP